MPRRLTPREWITLVGCVTAAAALATGCAAERSDDQAEPPIGEILVVADLEEFVLPLDKYLFLGPRAEVIESAERLLATQCMVELGFTFSWPDPPAGPPQGASRRYGLADKDVAAQWGYHHPEDPLEAEMDALGDAVEASMTPEMEVALFGERPNAGDRETDGPGGCLDQARATLAEGAPPVDTQFFAQSLAAEAYLQMLDDSRVHEAVTAWSECMRDAGYSYSSPREALNHPAWSTPEPTQAEITVAVADVRCKEATNLINIMATVEVAYQHRLIDENAEVLAEIDRSLDIQARNAADALASARR